MSGLFADRDAPMKTMGGFLIAVWRVACLGVCLGTLGARAAGNIDPAHKHGWSENGGWVNFAPNRGGVTVHFDGTNGFLTGCAWDENLGWIKLGANASGPFANTSATNWGVNLDATGTLSGYAWGENVGWINFKSANHQATIDRATGDVDGYAWGENIGWLHFKGIVPAYGVRTLAFDRLLRGTPNWWLDRYVVDEDYDDGDGAPAWQEYVADTDPTNPASYFCVEAVSNRPPVTVYFPSASTRYYTLQRCDALQAGGWSNVMGQTGVPGTGGPHSLQDTGALTQQNYRIEVRLAP